MLKVRLTRAEKQALNRDANVKAQRNLQSWKTILIDRKWYVLTKEAKEILACAITNGIRPGDPEEINLPRATKKDGDATERIDTILVADALMVLNRNM